MGRLTTKERKKLPADDFAGPNRTYPDENRSHAEDALARVSEYGSPTLKREVRRNVDKKYPGMVEKGDPDHGKDRRKQGKPYDPDHDGDDDATAAGDTDHDFHHKRHSPMRHKLTKKETPKVHEARKARSGSPMRKR